MEESQSSYHTYVNPHFDLMKHSPNRIIKAKEETKPDTGGIQRSFKETTNEDKLDRRQH